MPVAACFAACSRIHVDFPEPALPNSNCSTAFHQPFSPNFVVYGLFDSSAADGFVSVQPPENVLYYDTKFGAKVQIHGGLPPNRVET